jgi:peptide/nickel transport system ATP-binding protein
VTPLLAVEGLRVRFPVTGPVRALLAGVRDRFVDAVLDVSLALEAGRTLAVVGESGSGKTTLGRAILGLVPAQAGTVRLGGIELRAGSGRVPRAVRREAAFVFQDPVASLSPRMTVRSLVSEPFAIHRVRGADRAREAARLLEMVGLPAALAGRYPHELSGGQARRVGVARALALSPRLVIADEPTAGLDVSVQGGVLNLLADLQARLGLAYLVITHNLAVVRHVADGVAVMYLGRIVERGPTARVYARPAHPYTAALLAAQPVPDPARPQGFAGLEGAVPSLRRRPSGCEFRTRCPFARELCAAEVPAPREVAGGGEVRCHFPLG